MGFCGRPIRGSLVTATVLLMTAGPVARPAAASQGLHERKHDAKRQVEALEEQWREARLAGDVATMDKMLSDDYIGISMTGQVSTKPQQLDRVRKRRTVLTRIDLGDMQIKLVGAIAIVTSRADIAGTNDGVSIQGTYRYTRVYQRQPNGVWKITSFEATRVPSRQRHHREDASSIPPPATQP